MAHASQRGFRRTGQVLQQVSSPMDTLALARAAPSPIPARSPRRTEGPRERSSAASLGGLCTKARADAPLGCVHLLLRHHTSLDPDGLGVALVPCHDLAHQSLDLLSRARLGVERVQVPELRGRRLHSKSRHTQERRRSLRPWCGSPRVTFTRSQTRLCCCTRSTYGGSTRKERAHEATHRRFAGYSARALHTCE